LSIVDESRLGFGLHDPLVEIRALCMMGSEVTVIVESAWKEFPSWFVDFSLE
jgi:hypothetical protein